MTIMNFLQFQRFTFKTIYTLFVTWDDGAPLDGGHTDIIYTSQENEVRFL